MFAARAAGANRSRAARAIISLIVRPLTQGGDALSIGLSPSSRLAAGLRRPRTGLQAQLLAARHLAVALERVAQHLADEARSRDRHLDRRARVQLTTPEQPARVRLARLHLDRMALERAAAALALDEHLAALRDRADRQPVDARADVGDRPAVGDPGGHALELR